MVFFTHHHPWRAFLFYLFPRRRKNKECALAHSCACGIYIVRRSAHPRGAFMCNRNKVSYYDSGVKTSWFILKVYSMLYLYISAPLYEASCSKGSEKVFLLPPPLQNQPSMAVCNSAGIHAVCGCTINRVLRTTKLLPKVVICIIITWYTYWSCERMFWHLNSITQEHY